MSTYESHTAQRAYTETDSVYIEYLDFARGKTELKQQKEAFIAGKIYTPSYTYPELSTLYDFGYKIEAAPGSKETTIKESISDRKSRTYKAVLELEANRASGELSDEEYDLSAGMHESYLQKMMLAESAHRLQTVGGAAEQELAVYEFVSLNETLFGEIDVPTFEGIMTTERNRLAAYTPSDENGIRVKEQLEQYFEGKELDTEEAEIIDAETLGALREVLLEYFKDMLAAVPDTDETVKYGADECKDIINNALRAQGLYEKDWRSVVDPSISIPSTEVEDKLVKMPETTLRTADELRRLLVHEIGVHALRGQNGEEAGLRALKYGTAKYADVEEGEGVLFECALAGDLDNPSMNRARDRYIVAGLALGVDDAPRDARQTFEIAWRVIAVRLANDGEMTDEVMKQAKDLAFAHVDNAFRGTPQTMPGVIYRKLKMYWEGLQKNGTYYAKAADVKAALVSSLAAKHDHTDTEGEAKQVQTYLQEAA